jgi:hypothetical protein
VFLLPLVVSILLLVVMNLNFMTTTPNNKCDTPTVLHLAVLAHVLDILIKLDRMPAVWDHEYWGLLTNASFVLCFAPSLVLGLFTPGLVTPDRLDRCESHFLSLAKTQFGIFYLAATFWKINSSFLHPTTSCGTILMVELVGSYAPFVLQPPWIEGLVQAAPYMTLVVEALLGMGMLYCTFVPLNTRTSIMIRNATVLKATAFHLLIFFMPVNSAGGFSLECLSRFIWFFHSDEITQHHALSSSWQWWARTISGSLAMIAVRQRATGAPLDVGFLLACILAAMYGTLMITSKPPLIKDNISTITSTTIFMLVITITYAFLLPILGLQQMGAPTMYANLRSYFHGGNHYLVPTAILGPDLLYGGGLVQVMESTSASLNRRLGYIQSTVAFPSSIVTSLQPMIRHSSSSTSSSDNNNTSVYATLPLQLFPMCMFNPHSRNVLMDDYQVSNSPGTTTTKLLTSFILPISQVRRALAEARNENESFVVQLTSVSSNPTIRTNNDHQVSIIQLDSAGECQVLDPSHAGSSSSSCEENELARLLLAPRDEGWWTFLVDKILTPYPELVGFPEEICMS